MTAVVVIGAGPAVLSPHSAQRTWEHGRLWSHAISLGYGSE